MSISAAREEFEAQGLPDAHTLVMRYENGGQTEVWSTINATVSVRGGAKPTEIRAAFEKAACQTKTS